MLSGKIRDMRKPLSLREALEFLEAICEDDDNEVPTKVQALYIEPPYIEGDISGEDDGDDYGGIADNLCAAQLKSGCEIVLEGDCRIESCFDGTHSSYDTGFDDETHSVDMLDDCLPSPLKKICRVNPLKPHVAIPAANKDIHFTWHKDNSIAVFPIFPETNYTNCRKLRPHELFEKFFNTDLLEHICKCSNAYAAHHQKRYEELTVRELRVFIGILIVSGYNPIGSIRNMWSEDDDLRNGMVYNAMRRNRFLEINSILHFESALCKPKDSSDRPDTLWKLRPLTDHIKAKMLENFHPEQNLSYGESMIAYFGRHGCKQFIKGKPIRFGYKAWSLCTPSGYMINFEIYQSKNPRSDPRYEEKFGTCAAPLLCMIDDFTEDVQKLPLAFYFDNLFTGIPLLTYLSNRGYHATGTIRENRIPKSCPIPHKNDLRKEQRGYYQSVKIKETGIHLTKWVDNAVICLASTCFGVEPKSTASRYSSQLKKKITVPRPCVVSEYNKYMAGVARFDQNVSGTRIAFRGKKWWHCIFTWLIDASIQNSWLLHRHAGQNKTLMEFKRDVAIYYCKHYGNESKQFNRPSGMKWDSVKNSLRYDRTDHLVILIEKKRRCAGDLCKSIVRTACSKCDVGLCLPCFKPYHTEL